MVLIMTEVNYSSVILIGVFISIIGGCIAFIGGVYVGNAMDIWNTLAGVFLAIAGGCVAAIGGFITSLFKKE